jgi:hypothetical protein
MSERAQEAESECLGVSTYRGKCPTACSRRLSVHGFQFVLFA